MSLSSFELRLLQGRGQLTLPEAPHATDPPAPCAALAVPQRRGLLASASLRRAQTQSVGLSQHVLLFMHALYHALASHSHAPVLAWACRALACRMTSRPSGVPVSMGKH